MLMDSRFFCEKNTKKQKKTNVRVVCFDKENHMSEWSRGNEEVLEVRGVFQMLKIALLKAVRRQGVFETRLQELNLVELW